MKMLAQTTAATIVTLCSAPEAATAAEAPAGSSSLDAFTGRTLIAIDGSRVALAPRDGGLMREITKPDGGAQQTLYTFTDGTTGTIADTRDPATAIGHFHNSRKSLEAQFTDGHTETLAVTADGGLAMTLQTPDGLSLRMAWHPQKCAFDDAERRTALTEYARRSGSSLLGARRSSAVMARNYSGQRTAYGIALRPPHPHMQAMNS